ncbi:MAG: nucleoside monophosphate kinase, partial [Planctomycetes bacterium]|nr:nucleoside monophosphate kinase [Planctomycetota bacterium]
MSQERYRTVLFFGAPGVGKGTQGMVLGQLPGFHHLSSGDIFRSLDKESLEGKEVASYSSRGELVPDDLTIRICTNGLQERIDRGEYKPADDLLILDGIPRNVPQAEILKDTVNILSIVCFVYSDENVMVERMKNRALQQNRSDDADENVIRRRFEIYREQSEPVLDFYPKELIAKIDAVATPAAVLRNVIDVLPPLA